MHTSAQTESVRVFAELARSFIALTTEGSQLEACLLYRELVTLQSAALALPIGDASFEEPSSDHDLAEYHARREMVFRCLPPDFGFYHECLNPLEIHTDPSMAMGDAVDDLADILGDLETGLIILERHGPEAAAWSWQFSFKSHWRNHAVGLVGALAHLL